METWTETGTDAGDTSVFSCCCHRTWACPCRSHTRRNRCFSDTLRNYDTFADSLSVFQPTNSRNTDSEVHVTQLSVLSDVTSVCVYLLDRDSPIVHHHPHHHHQGQNPEHTIRSVQSQQLYLCCLETKFRKTITHLLDYFLAFGSSFLQETENLMSLHVQQFKHGRII